MTTAVQEDRVGQRGTHLGALGPEERPPGLCREGQKEVALCCHPEEIAELTSPYDSVHDQPGWIQLLGEVQGPPGRVLIRHGFRQEVHVRLQPLLVPCGENREGSATGAPTAGLRSNGGRGWQQTSDFSFFLFPEESCFG